MTTLNRRHFGLGAGALAATAFAAPRFAIAQGAANIVIIGGGPAGATVAGQIKLASPKTNVTLIEPQNIYTSCFYSNYFIGGIRTIQSLTHSYEGLKSLGITVVPEFAASIDTAKRSVKLSSGKELAYDKLAVAPGIAFKFDGIEGYNQQVAEKIAPHAWRGRDQSKVLHKMLQTMPDDGVVVIAPPKNPYRCPPGPYERACVIANTLKVARPKAKLIILDPKLTYSKQAAFEEAFNGIYKGIVEVHLSNDIDDQSLSKYDPSTGEITTKAGFKVKAAVANIIPPQKAGQIALDAGLGDGDWCPVNPENFTSTKAEHVYVLGDAAVSTDMPKSAYAASSQARVVATHILDGLAGKQSTPGRYRNTCWSFIATDNSAKIGADYVPGQQNGKAVLVPENSFVSKPGESASLRKEGHDESAAWYETLTNDMFQKTARN